MRLNRAQPPVFKSAVYHLVVLVVNIQTISDALSCLLLTILGFVEMCKRKGVHL